MKKNKRDNYVHFIHYFPEEKEIIKITCPVCFRETPYDLLKQTNRCSCCSSNINQEDFYVYTEII